MPDLEEIAREIAGNFATVLASSDMDDLRGAILAALRAAESAGAAREREACAAPVRRPGEPISREREAAALLDQWFRGEEPRHATQAFLAIPNADGWVPARELREERDFDGEMQRLQETALRAVTEAEERAAAAETRLSPWNYDMDAAPYDGGYVLLILADTAKPQRLKLSLSYWDPPEGSAGRWAIGSHWHPIAWMRPIDPENEAIAAAIRSR